MVIEEAEEVGVEESVKEGVADVVLLLGAGDIAFDIELGSDGEGSTS